MKHTTPHIFLNLILLLLLTGCGTTPDITTKLVVPESKPVVVTQTPVQLDNSDAKIRIRLASSNPLTNHVNMKLSLTNVRKTSLDEVNLKLNSAEYIIIPVYFNNYAIDSDKIHIALTYNDSTYPCLWEKNIIINRGQTLDIDESVSFTAVPVTITLPVYAATAKLSPNIFYKASGPIDIVVGDILGLAGPINSSRHVVITSKSKQDDAYKRANPDQSSVERNVGVDAYEKIKSLKLVNLSEVKYQATITDKGDSTISFVPDKMGEYSVCVWYTINGQYAYSELKFSVYDRL